MPLIASRAGGSASAFGGLRTFSTAAAVDTGAMFPINIYRVGSTATASVTFSSIPATYKHLQIRMMCQTNRASSSGDDIFMTFNGSSAANYYAYHVLYADGTNVLTTDNPTSTYIDLTRYSCVNNGALFFGAGVVDILDYASTTKHKTVRNLAGVDSGSSSGIISMSSGLWNPVTRAAITSITLVPSVGTGFSQGSSFALYGIKG